ncbi:ribonuclease E inhibitor RraB [Pseudoalteromonas viridis]|uniref:Ribonuclease E inhibitor RraB n=1 Tax=Pseudoalteromonas viridis TaxID=339617 RepID=A0ABX7VAU8_9GAMM|nr:ribonuclease E inhibitor RraB [Pseudoalteromonas viridis]QTL36562.1 ribonuclease E inhibitor RraB [Pseudoalteromonas viridis]
MDNIPNDETGAALKAYVKDGSDLSKPMNMDFFIAVPNKVKGDAIAQKVTKLGFQTSVEFDDEAQEWTCYCNKTIVPSYSNVVAIEKQLDEVSKPYGGYSDGFGSFGNAEGKI